MEPLFDGVSCSVVLDLHAGGQSGRGRTSREKVSPSDCELVSEGSLQRGGGIERLRVNSVGLGPVFDGLRENV